LEENLYIGSEAGIWRKTFVWRSLYSDENPTVSAIGTVIWMKTFLWESWFLDETFVWGWGKLIF
jgi:hypothetical protein